jgi:hypothetical protein
VQTLALKLSRGRAGAQPPGSRVPFAHLRSQAVVIETAHVCLQVDEVYTRVSDELKTVKDAANRRVSFLHDGRVYALKFFSKEV